MDGMLSQDEISALLSGMDASAENTDETAVQTVDPTGDATDGTLSMDDGTEITGTEKDAIGEIGNICMGAAATTLYSLVNRKVSITTPVVTLAKWESVVADYERPCVFIQIKYTAGLDGHNLLVLKEHDVRVIADLMMGGDGTNLDGELGELHLSAIAEAMNQMMGASATSLSTMLGKMIDISPPEASVVDLTTVSRGDSIAPFLGGSFVKIAFRMQIDDLVDSSIMQLYPTDFARFLCEKFLSPDGDEAAAPAAPAPAPVSESPVQPQMQQAPQMQMGGMPQMQMVQPMNIQPAQFQTFSGNYGEGGMPSNVDLIMDVPLDVTVELGRTKKAISEILDFSPGTIIELDKIAGEPVEVLVNGKLVARGEVVVIEESFGVRVTEIIK